MAKEFWVVFDHLPEFSAEMHRTVSRLVRKAAFDIEADAKTRAPVDTGFLRNSIYVRTHDQSTYDGSSGEQMLSEVNAPADDLNAYVAVGANYGLYVEMGTSHMAAQPYLGPAADFVRPEFLEAMRRLEASMKAVKP